MTVSDVCQQMQEFGGGGTAIIRYNKVQKVANSHGNDFFAPVGPVRSCEILGVIGYLNITS